MDGSQPGLLSPGHELHPGTALAETWLSLALVSNVEASLFTLIYLGK